MSSDQHDNLSSNSNKRQKAVALRYAEGDQAPKIVATGAGEIARRIIELAEQHNIPIQRNDGLADILSRMELGYEIPPETYRAVAEILAFLYRTDLAWRKRKELEHPNMAKPKASEHSGEPSTS
jgi:flagellar biosynthesis protein